MKIICLQENLKTSLNIAQNVVSRNLTLPILNNVLLETENGRLKVSSTNLEIGINTWTSGKIEKTGAITCPAKTLTTFINSLPNKKIELEVKGDNLSIKCETFKASIKGLPADDFPLIPKLKERPIFSFKNNEIFKNDLAQVIGAAAASESRPEISGIFFSLDKEAVKIVGTDGFRLAEKTIRQNNGPASPLSFIVPQRTIQELIRILSEKGGQEMNMVLGSSQILFDMGDVQLISRLIDGQYPDYQQIIPKGFETKATVLKDEFTNNVRIASIFSSKVNDIQLTLKDSKIEFSAQDADLGENKSQLEAQIQGKGVQMSFNFRYLLDGLSNIPTKQVFVGLNAENSPAILKPVGDDSFLYVIMPIKTA
ncbi:MAG: DNA polymerase III subunit beta [Candidatus Portnoybacteria bacterium]|nr:DNA polymerase III subunit beta [Candidatus Portnoybacteria bacterium]